MTATARIRFDARALAQVRELPYRSFAASARPLGRLLASHVRRQIDETTVRRTGQLRRGVRVRSRSQRARGRVRLTVTFPTVPYAFVVNRRRQFVARALSAQLTDSRQSAIIAESARKILSTIRSS